MPTGRSADLGLDARLDHRKADAERGHVGRAAAVLVVGELPRKRAAHLLEVVLDRVVLVRRTLHRPAKAAAWRAAVSNSSAHSGRSPTRAKLLDGHFGRADAVLKARRADRRDRVARRRKRRLGPDAEVAARARVARGKDDRDAARTELLELEVQAGGRLEQGGGARQTPNDKILTGLGKRRSAWIERLGRRTRSSEREECPSRQQEEKPFGLSFFVQLLIIKIPNQSVFFQKKNENENNKQK